MKYVIVLILISFISIVSLLHQGYPITHDGDVHLLRLTNFYQSLREGNSIPRWAENVNFGYQISLINKLDLWAGYYIYLPLFVLLKFMLGEISVKILHLFLSLLFYI